MTSTARARFRRYRAVEPGFRAHLRREGVYEPVEKSDLFYIERVGANWGSSLSLVFAPTYAQAFGSFQRTVEQHPEHSIMLLAAIRDGSWQELAHHDPDHPSTSEPLTFWQRLGDALASA